MEIFSLNSCFICPYTEEQFF